MAYDDKKQASKEEAFEMIELAADELDLLAMAFDIINDVCTELADEEEERPMVFEPSPAEVILH